MINPDNLNFMILILGMACDKIEKPCFRRCIVLKPDDLMESLAVRRGNVHVSLMVMGGKFLYA